MAQDGTKRAPTTVFGERVRARRLELGLSQESLAQKAGLHRTYVGSLERGERNVALINILKLGKALDLDAGSLITRIDT